MLAAVKGYYDGTQIIIDDDDRKNLIVGDELVITIVNRSNVQKSDTRAEKRRKIIDSGKYVTETGRTVAEIDNYIKELRDADRF